MSAHSVEKLEACARVVSIPLVTPFRGLTYREAMIFDAPSGPAEWSPFVEYDDAEASTWLSAALEAGWDSTATTPPLPPSIRVNGTIPAVSASEVAALLAEAGTPHTVKVKVAGPASTLAGDRDRVGAVRDVLGPTGRIRLDANGGWSVDEAEHAIRKMEHFDIDYVEQPVTSLEDMAEIRTRIRRLGIQVAADESIRRWSDLSAVIEAGACDVVVLKVQPLGGLGPTRKLIAQAQAAGLAVVISSALETTVGLYQGALLQAELETTDPFMLDAGLGTARFLSRDVVHHPLIAHGGLLELTPPELNYEALDALSASPERQEWWMQRLRRCMSAL